MKDLFFTVIAVIIVIAFAGIMLTGFFLQLGATLHGMIHFLKNPPRIPAEATGSLACIMSLLMLLVASNPSRHWYYDVPDVSPAEFLRQLKALFHRRKAHPKTKTQRNEI